MDTKMAAVLMAYCTMDAAADSLAVSRDTIRRMIRDGELEAVKIRKSVRVSVASLEAVGTPMASA
jgi:excisionase family DNA binding protein